MKITLAYAQRETIIISYSENYSHSEIMHKVNEAIHSKAAAIKAK